MKKLNALLFCAVAAPAYALAPANVFAADHDNATETRQEPDESIMGTGQQDSGMDDTTLAPPAETRDGRETLDMPDNESKTLGRTAKRTEKPEMSGATEGAFHATDLIGEDVRNRNTDVAIGSISDLAFGEDGQIVSVIVSTGGFLGMGENDVAVSWNEVERHLDADGENYVITVDRDAQSLEDAPAYERPALRSSSAN